jgi:hypothetical protein
VIILGSILVMWFLYNLAPIYIFPAQFLEQARIRRAIIEQIQESHPSFPTAASIYIGIPDVRLRDVAYGIPQFYSSPLAVFTVPPETWPGRPRPNMYRFQYQDGRLREIP